MPPSKIRLPVPIAELVIDPTVPILSKATSIAPLEIVVPPVYVLVPPSVKVPVGLLLFRTKASVLEPSLSTPLNDPGFAPATVSTTAFKPLFVMILEPAVVLTDATV